MKVTTIGGGSTYTPELVQGFIERHERLGLRELWLVDVDGDRLEVVGGFARRMVAAAGDPFQVHLTVNRRAALDGAAFVTTQIRVGQMAARREDEYLGRRWNLVGQETTGIGGMAKALRTVPVILSIAQEMRTLCPDAWLVNFTNPSGLVTDLPLRAGTADGVGLGAIAGSGTKVVGRNREGRTASSFGASYPFTDWGGGGDIAAAALHAIALAYRRMGPETALAERMLTATGCSEVVELLEKVMRGQVRAGGPFAPQVFECAVEGDVVAQSIVRRAGKTIGANVLSVAGELGMLLEPFDLVAAGGVFSSGNPLLYESLSETIRARASRVNVVRWQAPPVVGALLLALDLLDLPALPAADRLAASVSDALAL